MNMLEKKPLKEFYDSGLIMFVNQFLHIFGWAIVLEFDDTKESIVSMYPARCHFRGFNNKTQNENFTKLTNYMKLNADNLLKDLDV